MSRDFEFLDDLHRPLSSFQLSLIRAATPAIRQSRQADFHDFIADVLRGLREPTDADVRTACRIAAERYGRPPAC